jgi:hypothetical protein
MYGLGAIPGGEEITTDPRIFTPSSECPCQMASDLPSGEIAAAPRPWKIRFDLPPAGLISQTAPSEFFST